MPAATPYVPAQGSFDAFEGALKNTGTREDTMLPPNSVALLDSRVGFHIEGRGRPIVLLHSSMGSKGQWRLLVERMRRSHRLIAIDLYGYGASPMPDPRVPFSLQHEVRLVESVLRVALLPGETFHLVGHSYGAAVALQLASWRPYRLQSLALYEPMAYHLLALRHPGRVQIESVRDELQRCADRGEALLGAQRFIDYWSGAGSFAQLPRQVQMGLAGLVPKTLLDFAAVSGETSQADAYRCINVPVCLFSGTTGPRPPRDVIDVLADTLPHARRHRAEAGHMAPVTHSWLVNPVLECFIRGVDSHDTPQSTRTAAAQRA
ncbi:MAG TPA: alpha/beta hydrolase [Burkholderiaceae bacterium]|nr:alpha/beta hydrolase [Burkholderiaceae bacterium]